MLKDIEQKADLKLRLLTHYSNSLISIKNLSAKYADNIVFNKLTCYINKGNRISVIDANGSGKSTLLKLLMGEEITYKGNLKAVSNLKISYISQEMTHLKGNLKYHMILTRAF